MCKGNLRWWAVAALSLAFTYLFFLEYLPPFKRVHIPYDLAGYYYPLADYAFQSLRDGRFPQWDAGIYSGLPFAGNIAAALFYPPAWLAFAANAGGRVLAYESIEVLVIAHVCLAFLLCFFWLRRKGFADLSSVLGAGTFAFSGYLCQHLQHFEVTAGYAWMPLGLWGIDEAAEGRRWRPLWKVAAASALVLLAGYPPLWFVFAVCMVAYAALHWKVALGVVAALVASLAIAAVQLLPTMGAVAMKAPEFNYGIGIRDPRYILAYLLPNYSDFGIQSLGNREDQYLYLGAAALLGLLFLARVRDRRAWPPAIMAGVALVFATNPYGLVWAVVQHSSLLSQVCRDWYFLAGLALAAPPLAALGLDHALQRQRPRVLHRWAAPAAAGLLLGWAVRQIAMWSRGGLAAGWMSALELGVTIGLCALAIYILPGQKGIPRAVLAAALLIAVGVDYKVYGTSSRVNAAKGQPSWNGRVEPLPAMDEAVYWRLREHKEFRVAVDLTAPWPQELRHHGLSSPQGFDSFLPRQYQELMEGMAHFRTNREIDLDPANEEALRLLGVRYFITSAQGPHYPHLSKSPIFRLVEPSLHHYKVFEYLHARPPYGWDSAEGSVEPVALTPERRGFLVRSETGGRFALAEQFFPGWRATVDGKPVAIERWRGAFQSVEVPAGERQVEFRYRSPGLVAGSWISLASLLLVAGAVIRRR